MTCSYLNCDKPDTHFVMLGENEIAYSCLYHYCMFYGLDIKEEAKVMKKIKEEAELKRTEDEKL